MLSIKGWRTRACEHSLGKVELQARMQVTNDGAVWHGNA